MLSTVVPFVAKPSGDFAMDSTEPQDLAGDLLVGADAVRAFLVHLGMPETTDLIT
jgi:hypothetical protein